MTDKQVAEYLKAERELMRRYEEVKYGRFMASSQNNRFFEPLLTPLHEINAKVQRPSSSKKSVNVDRGESSAFASKRKVDLENDVFDRNYGLHPRDGKLFVGSQAVELVGDNLVFENGKKYVGTPGLWALLTEKSPKNYTEDDLFCYGQIVKDTCTYRMGNTQSGRVKANASIKYKTLIKPIINKYNLNKDKGKYKGEGLRKEVTSDKVEYVYWNSIDELLERLYVLYGEIRAGNTNPTIRNEISSILQEIKEI